MTFELGDDYEVALASAVFSLISILVTVLAIRTERKVFMNRQRVVVQFTVLGLNAKHRKFQTRTRGIARDIADLLQLRRDLVEIEQPRGFGFRVNLYVNDVQYKDMDYESVLEDAVNGGRLAEIIRNNWKLAKVPAIKDFKCTEMQSEAQIENTVHIVASMSAPPGSPPSGPQPQPQIVYDDMAEGLELASMPQVRETPFDGQQEAGRMRAFTNDAEEGADTKM